MANGNNPTGISTKSPGPAKNHKCIASPQNPSRILMAKHLHPLPGRSGSNSTKLYKKQQPYFGEKKPFYSVNETCILFLKKKSSAVEEEIHFCMCPSTHPSKTEEERRENIQASLLSQTDVTGRMKTIANPGSCSSSVEASQHADWPKLIQLSADTAETLLGHRQRQTLGDWKESV